MLLPYPPPPLSVYSPLPLLDQGTVPPPPLPHLGCFATSYMYLHLRLCVGIFTLNRLLFRYLSAEKLSLDSRLEKCERDYEQRLSIASDQVESLQQELQRCVSTARFSSNQFVNIEGTFLLLESLNND